jgi:hypothetical protein
MAASLLILPRIADNVQFSAGYPAILNAAEDRAMMFAAVFQICRF